MVGVPKLARSRTNAPGFSDDTRSRTACEPHTLEQELCAGEARVSPRASVACGQVTTAQTRPAATSMNGSNVEESTEHELCDVNVSSPVTNVAFSPFVVRLRGPRTEKLAPVVPVTVASTSKTSPSGYTEHRSERR